MPHVSRKAWLLWGLTLLTCLGLFTAGLPEPLLATWLARVLIVGAVLGYAVRTPSSSPPPSE